MADAPDKRDATSGKSGAAERIVHISLDDPALVARNPAFLRIADDGIVALSAQRVGSCLVLGRLDVHFSDGCELLEV